MVLRVLKLAYHMVITPIRKTIYVKYKKALGNIVNISLNIPYKLNFKTIPANIILPDKGDSTWAFNSQLFRYIVGVLTANAINIPININNCVICTKLLLKTKLKSVEPIRDRIVIIESNINKEPNRVYKKK